MQTSANAAEHTDEQRAQEAFLRGLLVGYRCKVAETAEEVAAALEVRRAVYHAEIGYDVPIPDEYDGRSWFLIAQDMETGDTVGTIRITPRSEGPVVVKPDGAGGGRGVLATSDRGQAADWGTRCFEGAFGRSASTVITEEVVAGARWSVTAV